MTSLNEMKPVAVLPNGYTLYCQPNDAGGYTYWSDEIAGGVMVWDTCLVNQTTIITALATENERQLIEDRKNQIAGKLREDNATLVAGKTPLYDIEEAKEVIENEFDRAFQIKNEAIRTKYGL